MSTGPERPRLALDTRAGFALAGGGLRLGEVPRPRLSTAAFSAAEWRRLAGFYGLVALLHVVGCGLFLHYSARYPALVGLGFAAYLFGLRHAFDADHIAAVDDSARYLMQRGERPLGIGFFFSLGHSSVVLVIALAVAGVSAGLRTQLPALQEIGGLIGAGVSGLFLWLIGLLNLGVLLGLMKLWRQTRAGAHSHAHLDALLARRGLLGRLFGGRLRSALTASWQLYPIGLLFGLGLDSAAEICLLAMSASAATGLPLAAVASLPILFAAGMTAMDTTDGVLMVKAYDWALLNPARRVFYNLATTGLSVLIALAIGTVQLTQMFVALAQPKAPLLAAIADLDLGHLGYAIVALFLFAWLLSLALWKFGRQPAAPTAHAHDHVHEDGRRHSHRHLH